MVIIPMFFSFYFFNVHFIGEMVMYDHNESKDETLRAFLSLSGLSSINASLRKVS